MQTVLVTGGAGFIGFNLVQELMVAASSQNVRVIVLDNFTYAGEIHRNDLSRLARDYGRLIVVESNICDSEVWEIMHECNIVFHLAAESHVDRATMENSITDFAMTNAYGTSMVLRAAVQSRKVCGFPNKVVYVSTDEVYGSVEHGKSRETDNLNPSSPYSASKAAGDMMALACYKTFGLPVIVTRCTNNFGPYQHPEKFIPRVITNLIWGKPAPVYGSGVNSREWIDVLDHCLALIEVAKNGRLGDVYNISTGNEYTNLQMARMICQIMGKNPEEWIEFKPDRPGHDFRYALDNDKICEELAWRKLNWTFSELLELTVKWYQENEPWWRDAKTEAEKMYKKLGR